MIKRGEHNCPPEQACHPEWGCPPEQGCPPERGCPPGQGCHPEQGCPPERGCHPELVSGSLSKPSVKKTLKQVQRDRGTIPAGQLPQVYPPGQGCPPEQGCHPELVSGSLSKPSIKKTLKQVQRDRGTIPAGQFPQGCPPEQGCHPELVSGSPPKPPSPITTKPTQTTHGDLAQEAARLLSTEYETSLTITQLCRRLGTNPFTLKTAFKQQYGTTIGRFKKAAVLTYAHKLLLETPLSLESIALKSGYSTRQNFTIAFRTHFGYTPGAARRAARTSAPSS